MLPSKGNLATVHFGLSGNFTVPRKRGDSSAPSFPSISSPASSSLLSQSISIPISSRCHIDCQFCQYLYAFRCID